MEKQEKISTLKYLKKHLIDAKINMLCFINTAMYHTRRIDYDQYLYVKDLISIQLKKQHIYEDNLRLMFSRKDKQSRINWIDEQIKMIENETN